MFTNKFDYMEDDYIALKIIEKNKGDERIIPFYYYDIFLKKDMKQIGKISIRIGNNSDSYYNGHIGYEINEEYQGNKYSYRAAKLVINVAKYHKMEKLYLVCDFDNYPSINIIERLNFKYIETIVPPKDYVFYYEGIKPQKIYYLEI